VKALFFSLMTALATVSVSGASVSGGDGIYNDGFIAYAPVKLTEAEKQTVAQSVEGRYKAYEPEAKRMTDELYK
jgi:hypothetical protein